MSVGVLSYNVRYAEVDTGEDVWAKRRDGVASVISFHDPDVVCLQEVWLDQLDDLRERLPGYEWVAHEVHNGEHTPIGYRPERFVVADEAVLSLSETPDQPDAIGWDASIPRVTTTAVLEERDTGEAVRVVSTHFDHEYPTARRESARLLADRFAEGPLPTLLAGDFNATPDDEPYRIVSEAGLRDAREVAADPHGPETTFNDFEGAQPGKRIDHVFVSESVEIERFGVRTDLDSRGLYPSDHFALFVECAFA
ncbi:endonuclease/exonuclease/phosphatase family protein [Natronomonas sp.]|uniref:endonuclease/exonuclease/phosphatase family protein n=1 Tax=Natronomonas sp. TaxID=2184060 RepID=UPI002FC3B0A5